MKRSTKQHVFCAGLLTVLIAAMPVIDCFADGVVKIRLRSGDANMDLQGTGTLQGKSLNGHLIGDGSDMVVTGRVDSNTVRINVAGRIVLGCGPAQQFMSGIDANDGQETSIGMTLNCPYRPSLNFVIDLVLPAHPLIGPSSSNLGESASLE